MKKLFLLFYLFTGSLVISAQQRQSDKQLIRKVLTNYIEGRNNGDTARLSSAFHPQADLRSRDEKTGKLMIWPIADYINRFTPGAKINCTGKIISINIAGNAAQAKIKLYYPDKTYADYFNLLKIDEKWVIASKIFSIYPARQ
ncbi:nuclear transport factor 2 family protein [Chryseobacterium polytrichastri]|uniref:Putative lumazine-binding n=1 Tax=Chryseobacterium polytrichastri TaxID=1302687 RepID=A0A1M6PQ82_9FLAO|nr:nuclear transport factor 2 family protein [Chryseobacterium polytrichastri]SHK10087.1 Putative lumazine-binding [Chryseobacterium polytrichastri]